MKINKVINGIVLLLSISIIWGVLTFAHVCHEMKGMVPACYSTKIGALILSVLVGSLSLFIVFAKQKQLWYVLFIVRFILSLAIIGLPIVIAPVCEMKTMHCYVYTRPFLILTGVILIGIQLISLITVTISKGKANEI
ncbi:DUF4418 family protein [Cellulosilyticum ruminicola]|uniref:DUF4418 family protein n=1 Tax=Cellulosilyticum ruminicola TaxID=425254 RepID=UPI0006CF9F16|nr:DUF4418 family protein [Cellulosilyticum ruminicola]